MLTKINKILRNKWLIHRLSALGRRIEGASSRRICSTDGQVAVVLIVIIAIALIFYAVSLNMGKITQTKTQITIASNQAAGVLASQMASYGQQIFMVSLGGKFKQCKLTMVGFIFFFALLVVVLIWTPVLAASVMTIVMSAAIATVAITIDIVVIQPGLDALFNKHIAINLDQASAFLESGIRTALQSSISDSKRVLDELDGDTDGLFGETGGVPNDEISRFGVYYLERLKSIENTASPAIQNFIDALRELVYEGSDGFGLYDPVGASYGCLYDPAMGNQVPSVCNKCCVPLSVINPDGSTDDIRETCCNPPCTAAGTCPEWPPCGVDVTCPLQTGITPGISQFGAAHPWDYDPYYEEPGGFVSFREQLGRDDENAVYGKDIDNITMIEQSIGPYTDGFRIEDTTGFMNWDPLFGGTGFGVPGTDPRPGIFSFFYKIKDWAFDLSTLDPSTEIDHCYWYSSEDPDYGCICENSPEPMAPELENGPVGGGPGPSTYACCHRGGGANYAGDVAAAGAAVLAADPPLAASCNSVVNQETFLRAVAAQLQGSGFLATYDVLNGHDAPNRGDLIAVWRAGDPYMERYDAILSGGACDRTLSAAFTQIYTGDIPLECIIGGPGLPPTAPGDCLSLGGTGCAPGSGIGSGGGLYLPIDPFSLVVNTTFHVDMPGTLLAPDQVNLPDPNYIIAGDTVCAQYVIYPYYQQYNGFWKEGGDRYCSDDWPYFQTCAKHGPWGSPTDGPCSEPDGTGGMVERDCACGEIGVASSTPGPQPAGTPPGNWPDDVLDDIIYQLPDFFEFAERILPVSIEQLTKTFTEWYPDAAEWIEPGVYSGASQSSPTMPCYLCEHEDGFLWRWLTNLREIQARFIRLRDESHASDFCDAAWCGPSAAILDSCTPNIYPDEAAHMGTFTLENTVECLYFNETGRDYATGANIYPGGNDVRFQNCWDACAAVQFPSAARYPLGTLPGWVNVNRMCGDQASTYLPRSLLPGFDANMVFEEALIPTFSSYLTCPDYCATCLAGCSAAFGRCQVACDTAQVNCHGPIGCGAINPILYPAERAACDATCDCEREWCMFGTNACLGTSDPNEGCQIYLDDCEDDECICDIPGQTDPNPYLCLDWAADNQTFYNRLSDDAENRWLKGTCDDIEAFPGVYFWPDVQQSSLEAMNQIAKFTHRRAFLEARLNEINFIITIFDDVITNLEDFLTGPAADLIRARINYNNEPLPYHVVYGWQGDPNKRGQRGLWHIVKVEGRIPGRCDGFCDATQTGPAEWPRIRSYKRWLGLQRCYELTATDGTVKMRVIRYDERRPSNDLFFPNSIRIWSFRNHPNQSPLNFAGNIQGVPGAPCPPLPHPQNIYDGAFLTNGTDSTGAMWNSALPSDNAACWAEANRLLTRYGVMSETCAKYYYQEGDRSGFDFQFVPCRPF